MTSRAFRLASRFASEKESRRLYSKVLAKIQFQHLPHDSIDSVDLVMIKVSANETYQHRCYEGVQS